MQGKQAGEAIADFLLDNNSDSLAHYQDSVFEQFNQYLGLRHYLYQRERRFADDSFWQRRINL